MKRTSALLVSLVVLAAGCSGGDDGADTTSVSTRPVVITTTSDPPSTTSAPVTTTATTQPSSTPSTTTTDAPTTAPTTVSTDQTDWASVVQTLGQRRQDLYAAPDVSRIREVCAEESPCAEQLDVQLADLANKGWHVVDADPYTVVRAELEDFDGESLDTALVVTVVVEVQRPANGGSIVDSSGAVVAGIDP